MKNMITVVSLAVLFFFTAVHSDLGVCDDDYGLTADPVFSKAKESFDKGIEFRERGDREFRGRPGLAQKLYEHAEDYILNASFIYKEVGHEHGIDTRNEVDICDGIYRGIHVKINKARKKARKR